MTRANPLSTAEPWDLISDAYTAELLPQFELYAREALKLAGLGENAHIADVAGGPGTLSILAAQEGATVTAVDLSESMLAHFRNRIQTLGLSRITIHHGDGQNLPLGEQQFDAAFCLFGLIFFPDRIAGFRELHRILKTRGRAIVSSWAPFEGPFVTMLEAIRFLLPDLPFGKGQAPLGNPADFKREMQEGGFKTVTIHPASFSMNFQTVGEFWESCQRSTAPVVLLARKLGAAEWERISLGVLHRLEEEYGNGPVESVGKALIGVGIK